MGDMTKEPSMEEILSSIKRIIAEEGEEAVQAAPRRGRADAAPKPVIETGTPDEPAPVSFAPMVDEVLELTDEVVVEDVMPAPKAAAKATPAAKPAARRTSRSCRSKAKSPRATRCPPCPPC